MLARSNVAWLFLVPRERNALTDFWRQFLVDAAGADLGSVNQHDRHRRGERHNHPHQAGKSDAAERDDLQDHRVARGKMTHHTKGRQKHHCRNAGDDDEPKINSAMQDALVMAMMAVAQMLFVIATHLRRQAADVVTPASQNAAYYAIVALAHGVIENCRIFNCRIEQSSQDKLPHRQTIFQSPDYAII